MPPLGKGQQEGHQEPGHGQQPPGINGPLPLLGRAWNEKPAKHGAQYTERNGHVENHPPVKEFDEDTAKAPNNQPKGDGHIE
jgi:hypothetical protein